MNAQDFITRLRKYFFRETPTPDFLATIRDVDFETADPPAPPAVVLESESALLRVTSELIVTVLAIRSALL